MASELLINILTTKDLKHDLDLSIDRYHMYDLRVREGVRTHACIGKKSRAIDDILFCVYIYMHACICIQVRKRRRRRKKMINKSNDIFFCFSSFTLELYYEIILVRVFVVVIVFE